MLLIGITDICENTSYTYLRISSISSSFGLYSGTSFTPSSYSSSSSIVSIFSRFVCSCPSSAFLLQSPDPDGGVVASCCAPSTPRGVVASCCAPSTPRGFVASCCTPSTPQGVAASCCTPCIPGVVASCCAPILDGGVVCNTCLFTVSTSFGVANGVPPVDEYG